MTRSFRLTRPALACLLVLVAAGLAACGSGSGTTSAGPSTKPADFTTVRAYVRAAGKLDRAKVSFTDAAGKPLPTPKPGATITHEGTFEVPMAELPLDFRIATSGGTIGGQAFSGSIRLDVHGYRQGEYLVLNEATTLAAAYRDAHPTHTVAEANAAIRRFLGLPPLADLGWSLMGSSPLFGHDKFGQLALAAGGFDPLVASLVAEADRGGARGRQFPATLRNDVVADSAGIVSVLVKAAIGGVAGAAFNKLLTETGISVNVGTALENLNAQLVGIQSEMSQLQSEIQQGNLDVTIGNFTTLSAIESAMNSLVWVTSDTGTSKQADQLNVQCVGLKLADVAAPKGVDCSDIDVTGNYQTLIDVMAGTDGATPLPQAWNAAYKAEHSTRFLSANQQAALSAQYNTWYALGTAQLLVITNALNAEGLTETLGHLTGLHDVVLCDVVEAACPAGTVMGSLARYKVQPLVAGSSIDLTSGLMWATDWTPATPVTYTDAVTDTAQLNANADATPAVLLDTATGTTSSVKLDGWVVPSKEQVAALFGGSSESGSTPTGLSWGTWGQWLAAQLDSDGTADWSGGPQQGLWGWNGRELWTSQYWYQCSGLGATIQESTTVNCTSHDAFGSDGHVAYELDKGDFSHPQDSFTTGFYSMPVRPYDSTVEMYVPPGW